MAATPKKPDGFILKKLAKSNRTKTERNRPNRTRRKPYRGQGKP
jgi:hypothetical protein